MNEEELPSIHDIAGDIGLLNDDLALRCFCGFRDEIEIERICKHLWEVYLLEAAEGRAFVVSLIPSILLMHFKFLLGFDDVPSLDSLLVQIFNAEAKLRIVDRPLKLDASSLSRPSLYHLPGDFTLRDRQRTNTTVTSRVSGATPRSPLMSNASQSPQSLLTERALASRNHQDALGAPLSNEYYLPLNLPHVQRISSSNRGLMFSLLVRSFLSNVGNMPVNALHSFLDVTKLLICSGREYLMTYDASPSDDVDSDEEDWKFGDWMQELMTREKLSKQEIIEASRIPLEEVIVHEIVHCLAYCIQHNEASIRWKSRSLVKIVSELGADEVWPLVLLTTRSLSSFL